MISLLKKGFKRGGIKLPEFRNVTAITEKKGIVNAPIPKIVQIPVLQHIGKPAQIIVKVGDTVEEGALIAKMDSDFSSNIHASIPGKVTKIGDLFTPAGIKSQFIEIEFNGTFKNWDKKNENWEKFKAPELLDKIKNAGIVGMGGAAFPTHIKLNPSKKIDKLIINGAECEPFLTSDERVMIEKATEIKAGIKIIKKILNPYSIVVAIEDNKMEAVEALKKVADKEFEVVILKTRYPQGGEKQLIEAVYNQEVPKGKLPFDINIVVQNVATVFAIYEAVVFDKPLIETVVTVSGQIVKWPGNYKVRVGTLVSDLLHECQIFTDPRKIIIGGPMMGVAQYTAETPITKATSGIIIFAKEELQYRKERPCIRCGRCMGVCPIGLYPNMMYYNIQVNNLEEAKKIGLHDCIECGGCSYKCPSKIPLVSYFKSAKINLNRQGSFYLNRIPAVRSWKYDK